MQFSCFIYHRLPEAAVSIIKRNIGSNIVVATDQLDIGEYLC